MPEYKIVRGSLRKLVSRDPVVRKRFGVGDVVTLTHEEAARFGLRNLTTAGGVRLPDAAQTARAAETATPQPQQPAQAGGDDQTAPAQAAQTQPAQEPPAQPQQPAQAEGQANAGEAQPAQPQPQRQDDAQQGPI